MAVHPYNSKKAHEITSLFHICVHSINSSFYSKEEQEAWSPTPPDFENWQRRLDLKKPFLWIEQKKVLGFIELEENGHVDCLYVHPEFQRQGIAKKLLDHVEKIAHSNRVEKLYTEASKLARPLFEQQGFRYIKTNEIPRKDVVLINYTMEKIL